MAKMATKSNRGRKELERTLQLAVFGTLSEGLTDWAGMLRHRAMQVLGFLLLMLFAAQPSLAQDDQLQPLLFPGNAAATGFSGVTTAYGKDDLPENSTIADETFININGSSLRLFALEQASRDTSQPPSLPQAFEIGARDLGQVFGLALDNRTLPGGALAPNIYVTATSAYGLHIVSPDADGDGLPERVKQGGAEVKWMEGLFGLAKSGGPGSVWKIDGTTGEVSLFADIKTGGVANSGPGLGNIVFDATNRQFFIGDRDTGLIHRLDISGQELSIFDHGVDGRAARDLEAVRHDPDNRADITSPEFRSDDPATWGFAALPRRVWGLALHQRRLFYAVADGPQIWSVAINNDGGFGTPRWELDLPADIEPYEVSDISFTARGRMVLAQRGQLTGAYDYLKPIKSDGARLLRFRLEAPDDPSTPSRWIGLPDEYAVGQTGDFRNSDGGVALGFGYSRRGGFNYRSCKATLWSTGYGLRQVTKRTPVPRPAAARDETLFLDGLQGNATTLVRPENTPPRLARFVDFDGVYSADETRGWMGDIEIPVVCLPQDPYVPPPAPLPPAQSILDLAIYKQQIGVCSIGGICSFEISITNIGNQTYRGPLAINDVVSQPGIALVGYGANPWICGQTGVDISCRRPELALRPGRVSRLYVDFKLKAKILIPGWRNCAAVTWLGNATSESTIRALQIEFASLGFYAGPIDGLLTPATVQAVSDFQFAAGLPPTGVITPALLDILFGNGARLVGDANPDNDRDCADVQFIAGPGPGPIPFPDIFGLDVTVGGQAECPFGQDCLLGLTIRNTLPVPFDQVVDGVVGLNRLGVAVAEQIALTPSFCAGPIAQMDIDCRFRLQLGPNQARSYPLRLNIHNALLDPADAANHEPDGKVRAHACFAVEDLSWFGWIFGQEFDRDCHKFIVPDGIVAPIEGGQEGPEAVNPEDDAPDGPLDPIAGRFGPQLSVSKVAGSRSCRANGDCAFSITVANNGIVPYQGPLEISEQMSPKTARLRRTTPSPWACNGADGNFICRHPTLSLGIGQSKTVRLTFRMPNAARGDVRNCARLSWQNNTFSGRAVAAKQALKAMGFDPGAAHSRLTSKAQQAIRTFQRRQNMRVTGAIDGTLMKVLVQGWGVGDQDASDDTMCVGAAFIKAPQIIDPGPVVTPISCPRGHFFDSKINRCRARCASGLVFDGKQCVSRCPVVERWNGKQCVNRCSAGQLWNERSNRCVSRCSASKQWNGTQCANRCSSSQRWNARNNRCVSRCSSSQRWNGKQCVNRCSASQRWNGKQCVSQCSRGKVFDAKRNRCVCPSGKTEVRGQCLTIQSNPGGQTISPGLSTVRPAPRCTGGKVYNAKRRSCVCPLGQLDVRGKCTSVRIQPGQTINPNLILPR